MIAESRTEHIMNGYDLTLHGAKCTALPSGALYLAAPRVLCVSDLHLGKSERIARRSGIMLPPYETRETLEKLGAAIAATNPDTVICLGDSFDDLTAAQSLSPDMQLMLTALQAGREWVWIEGNHDPGPIDMGGSHLVQISFSGLTFRHISSGAPAEISGHYHPKHRLAGRSRPAFLFDTHRLIMPAFGTYTGGLSSTTHVLRNCFSGPVTAVLTGRKAIPVPVPVV